MKYTNTLDLPAPYARAASKESYDKGEADYTPTQLTTPPRLYQLRKRHDAELTEDVSTRLWVLGGTIVHQILERAGNEEKELFEKRLYASVAGKKVGGKLDTLALAGGLLTDYKWTGAFALVRGRSEWVSQVNMYAFLARENGFKVTALEIFGMCRDWTEYKALQSKDYPRAPCVRIPIEMWPHEQTREFIKERIAVHETAAFATDEGLAPCTPEERWQKETTYAVMKPGRKSALSVHQSMETAQASLIGGTSIVTRPGKSVRCASYCPVSGICSTWRNDPSNVPEVVE